MTPDGRDEVYSFNPPESRKITLRVSEELLELLEAVAEAHFGGNRSEAARAALRAFVDAVPETSDGSHARQPVGQRAPDDDATREPETDGGRDASDAWAAEAWREVGHMATWLLFMNGVGELQDAIWPIEEALQEGRAVDETAIREARRALDQLRRNVEDYAAPLADGDVEPWDAGAGSTVPHGVMADHLERYGYEVDRPGE